MILATLNRIMRMSRPVGRYADKLKIEITRLYSAAKDKLSITIREVVSQKLWACYQPCGNEKNIIII